MLFYECLRFFLIITYAVVTLANFAIGATVLPNYRLCTTNFCRELANNISANLDTREQPCNNFYRFACGGWTKNHPVNDNDPLTFILDIIKKNTLQRIREILESQPEPNDSISLGKIRKLFHMCKNEVKNKATGMTPVTNVVQNSGGSSIFPPYSYDNATEHTTWQQISDKHPKNKYGNGLYRIIVDDDITDNGNNVIIITKPSLFISHDKLIAMETDSKIKKVYISYIKMISYKVFRNSTPFVDKKMIARNILELVEFEIELAKLTMEDDNERYIEDTYKKSTIKELQHEYDALCNSPNCNINWLNVITKLFARKNITIELSEKIVVKSPKYLMDLIPLLERTSSSTIANYIQWTHIRKFLSYVYVPMKKKFFEEVKNLLGFTSLYSPAAECTHDLYEIYLTVISYEYTRRYVSLATIGDVKSMITKILNVTYTQIKSSTWTDRFMRRNFLNKLRKMKNHVSTPSWYNKAAIDEYYKDFVITSDDFSTNIKELKTYEHDKMIEKLKMSKDISKWIIREKNSYYRWDRLTTKSNAMYFRLGKHLSVFGSLLQDPIYNEQRPLYMNYGSLGVIIGHEINHGFDNTGYLYNSKTKRIKWQGAHMDKYDQNSQCFVQQFNNYQINAKYSLDEIIADSAGIVAAYKAFQIHKPNNSEMRLPGLEQYDDNQMFFLSYAQSFCENSLPFSDKPSSPYFHAEFRIVGGLSNFPEFSTVYNCPKNSKMNPVSKCSLWH